MAAPRLSCCSANSEMPASAASEFHASWIPRTCAASGRRHPAEHGQTARNERFESTGLGLRFEQAVKWNRARREAVQKHRLAPARSAADPIGDIDAQRKPTDAATAPRCGTLPLQGVGHQTGDARRRAAREARGGAARSAAAGPMLHHGLRTPTAHRCRPRARRCASPPPPPWCEIPPRWLRRGRAADALPQAAHSRSSCPRCRKRARRARRSGAMRRPRLAAGPDRIVSTGFSRATSALTSAPSPRTTIIGAETPRPRTSGPPPPAGAG